MLFQNKKKHDDLIAVFPHPTEHNHMAEHSEHSCVFLICLSLVCCVMLAQSQKCQTERTAFLCLSPWPGWHSGCGTDGRQLHLSGFLYLLFGNQWLHYRRPVQLHSLAVSEAVCSVCLSFSWAVSNWILAGMLIAHSAAFAISSSTSPSLSVLTSVFNLPSSLGFMSSPDSWPSVWSSLYHPSLNIIPVFADSSAVAHMWL